MLSSARPGRGVEDWPRWPRSCSGRRSPRRTSTASGALARGGAGELDVADATSASDLLAVGELGLPQRTPARAFGTVARAGSFTRRLGSDAQFCCSKRRGGSSRSTASSRARLSRRSRRRCSPVVSAPARTNARWPKPPPRRDGPNPDAADLLLDGSGAVHRGHAPGVTPLSRALHASRNPTERRRRALAVAGLRFAQDSGTTSSGSRRGAGERVAATPRARPAGQCAQPPPRAPRLFRGLRRREV